MKTSGIEDQESKFGGARKSEFGGEKKTRWFGRWWKRLVTGIGLLIVVYLVGPRISNSEIERREVIGVPKKPGELDDYLAKSEGRFSDIVPGTEKVIRWQAGHEGKQTEISVIYLHGFGGTHPTLAPAMDMVADGLGAHLFCTRYAGHGRKTADGFGKAMGEASLQEWVDDTAEALAIGRLLGKRLVVIANSTAAPIASWLAAQGDAPDAFIFWSPNFGLTGGKGEFLLGPWGEQLLALRPGETYSQDPERIHGPLHEKYAMTSYPDSAFLTLMAAIKLGRDADLGKVTCPTLCLFSRGDQVVSPKAFQKLFGKFGHSGNQLVEVMKVTHRDRHVLAGDLMSPESAEEVVEATLEFIQKQFTIKRDGE